MIMTLAKIESKLKELGYTKAIDKNDPITWIYHKHSGTFRTTIKFYTNNTGMASFSSYGKIVGYDAIYPAGLSMNELKLINKLSKKYIDYFIEHRDRNGSLV